MRWIGLSFAPKPKYNERFARRYRNEPWPEFSQTLPCSGKVHHYSGVNTCALAQTTLKTTEHTQTQTQTQSARGRGRGEGKRNRAIQQFIMKCQEHNCRWKWYGVHVRCVSVVCCVVFVVKHPKKTNMDIYIGSKHDENSVDKHKRRKKHWELCPTTDSFSGTIWSTIDPQTSENCHFS